jgi:hypothetical protein
VDSGGWDVGPSCLRTQATVAPAAPRVSWLAGWGMIRRLVVSQRRAVMGVDTTQLEDEEIRTSWPMVRAQGGATVSDGDSGDDADSSDSDGDSGDDSDSSDSGSDSDSDSGDDSGDDSDSTDR